MGKNKNRKEFDVAVIGEINADLILRGNTMPEFNQVEKIVDHADLVMGSSAVIFACGIARLGLRTVFIGKVGDDVFGEFMLSSMRNRNIDVSNIIIDNSIRTGLSVILARDNDRAILTYPGSIPELTYEEINLDLISRCRHLHLGGFFLLNNLKADIPQLFKEAKKLGVSTSLDTNYDPSEKWDENIVETLDYVDIFLPNEVEARAISRQDDLDRAVDYFIKKVEILAIKLGKKGAIAKQNGFASLFQPTVSVNVADTVGSGDSFDSGFIYGYLNNWPTKESLKLAVACGSLSTLVLGGTDGQATLAEASNFINRHFRKGINI